MMPREKRQPYLGTKGSDDLYHDGEANTGTVTHPTNAVLLIVL